MKANSVLLLFLASKIVSAQAGFGYVLGDVQASIEQKLEPSTPAAITDGFSTGIGPLSSKADIGFSRFLMDDFHHEYFGYSVIVERMGTTSNYRLTFSALDLRPEHTKVPTPSAWKRIAGPIFPEPQIVHSGDTIALELFKNEATGQRLVDHIRLASTAPCDGSEQCLTSFLADALNAVKQKVAEIEETRTSLNWNDVAQSQQLWGKYSDQACSAIPDRVRQLECELKLTRSRLYDLSLLY